MRWFTAIEPSYAWGGDSRLNVRRRRPSLRRPICGAAAMLLWLLVAAPQAARGQIVPEPPKYTTQDRPDILKKVGIDQKLGAQVDPNLEFVDSTGQPVRLGQYLDGDKPVVFAFVYYECPMLCTLILNGMVKAFNVMSLSVGEDFEVVNVSMDHKETPDLAASKKEAYLGKYNKPRGRDGWHFLTGSREHVEALAEQVGFRFRYDEGRDEYAHGSALMVLTPDGKVSKYHYGVEYSPRDLRLSLVDASAGQIGNAVDKLVLFCYQYDPTTGEYGVVIMNVLRLTGAATVLALGLFILVNYLRDRRKQRNRAALGSAAESPSSGTA